MKILLAEDEPLLLDVLTMLLKSDGHSVVAVANGHEALQRFRENQFDLVITDYFMPRCDGPGLAKEIKAVKPQQPILLLSGSEEVGHPPNFDWVLAKPIQAMELLDLVRQVKTG